MQDFMREQQNVFRRRETLNFIVRFLKVSEHVEALRVFFRPFVDLLYDIFEHFHFQAFGTFAMELRWFTFVYVVFCSLHFFNQNDTRPCFDGICNVVYTR